MSAAADSEEAGRIQVADDVCALPLVRRLSATLDIDPARWREGEALPRGWHLAFFSVDTPQSRLRADGLAGLGVALPDVGLPRIVFGGRSIRFHGDVPIGAHLRRESRLVSLIPKQGRTGRLAVAQIEHRIFAGGQSEPAIVETQTYVLREAATAPEVPKPVAVPQPAPPSSSLPSPTHRRVVIPDEMLLFRVSAAMFNPHRIHYDQPYALGSEGYPALVVNGSVASLLLLEYFRAQSRLVPDRIELRSIGLAFCGQPLGLNLVPGPRRWKVWADTPGGLAVEGEMGLDDA